MDKINVNNTINQEKITVQIIQSIDREDTIILDITSDIELTPLVLHMVGLIEKKRKLEYNFNDPQALAEGDTKVLLIKNTIIEIYDRFNKSIENNETETGSIILPVDDDLPF